MRIESKLCHISENKAVVQVNGWLDDKNVGSALAEGFTVEQAEDNAISRLNKRLGIINKEENSIKVNYKKEINTKKVVELPKSEKVETINVNKEPSDWSNELTAIDSEIKRLNWSRDDEIKFLETNLGHNSRNKITKYKELVNYLNILKKINNLDSSSVNTNNIENMIKESDIILKDLSWNYKQGREYLQKEFNVSSRKELDEKQLISFLSKLKKIRNQNLSM
tara:strand:+ start:3238 stop:3906 length:669 start_codon:yes stop_codon:yes gene_type:complete